VAASGVVWRLSGVGGFFVERFFTPEDASSKAEGFAHARNRVVSRLGQGRVAADVEFAENGVEVERGWVWNVGHHAVLPWELIAAALTRRMRERPLCAAEKPSRLSALYTIMHARVT
jgi:hypothetical protein